MTNDLPSREQQEATARRFRGQQALVTPEVVQEAVSPPAPQPGYQRPTRGFRRAFWHWARRVTLWTLVGLVLAAIGGRQVDGPHFAGTGDSVPAYPTFYPLTHPATVILAVALGVLAVFWFLVGMGYYMRLIWQTIEEALRPIPSLAEIELGLRQAGFNPSIADVVALHQHLTSQRNEAAFFAGALIIGPQLLARQAQGNPVRP
jgi:hypothetical protein